MADPSLTPDVVREHTFTAGFRGYDQAEVRQFLTRVANEMRTLREQVEQVESMWRSAEERAARPPVLDEDTLMAAVGEETAAILRAARSAAAEVRNRASADADRIVAEAHELGAGLRSEAESVLSRETGAAEAAALQILDAARSEAAQLVDRARAEADVLRAAAQQEKKLTIEGASATRERILDDLSRRRRVASVQIEQLRAGRERLIDVYALVRKTLDEVQQELSRADTEARAAADAAGRRMQAETPDIEIPLAEPEAEAKPDATSAPETTDRIEAAPETGLAASADESSHADEPTKAEPAVDLTEEAATPAPEAAADPAPASTKGSKVSSTTSGSGRNHGTARVEAVAHAEALTPPPPTVSAPPVPHLRVVPDPVEARAETDAEPDVQTPAEPTPAEPPVAETATPAEPARPGGKVDLLFARIRAGRREEAEPAAPSEPEAPTPVAQARAADQVREPGEVRSDADEALLQRREAVVMDLEISLTRKLKRGLQDEQNDLLDRLRSLRHQPTAARLLPSLDDQTARYVNAAQPLVDKAAAAGATFAAEMRGKKPAKTSTPVVADLAKDAATSIVEPLRRRLEQVISSGAAEDQAVLVEALGSAYREWKSQRIERIAGDTLSAAFSRGTWHEVPAGTPLRWVVEDVDGPCPDCDDDALAGSLPKGEVFPTGQPHPPAHSGCRCLLVPDLG